MRHTAKPRPCELCHLAAKPPAPTRGRAAYNLVSYNIASISEITTPIDKKFQDNIWTTKMCDEIRHTTANGEPDYRLVTKNWNFLNSRWRWTPSWKSFSGHNSSTDCPISAKFCMRKQNGMSTRATWQKLQIFKIQDGGQPPFWKSLNRHISVKNRPILMKFGTLRQMQIAVSWPKIEIFQIQDGGGRHLENRFFGHNSSTDCPITAKFCMRKQNGMSTRTTWQKLNF